MKKSILAVILLMGASIFTTQTMQAGRGGAFAGGLFAGVVAGSILANAAYDEGAYYGDLPVYDVYYPETTRYGVYDYPAYVYYPGYAYSVDVPVYMYPDGYEYAY